MFYLSAIQNSLYIFIFFQPSLKKTSEALACKTLTLKKKYK